MVLADIRPNESLDGKPPQTPRWLFVVGAVCLLLGVLGIGLVIGSSNQRAHDQALADLLLWLAIACMSAAVLLFVGGLGVISGTRNAKQNRESEQTYLARATTFAGNSEGPVTSDSFLATPLIPTPPTDYLFAYESHRRFVNHETSHMMFSGMWSLIGTPIVMVLVLLLNLGPLVTFFRYGLTDKGALENMLIFIVVELIGLVWLGITLHRGAKWTQLVRHGVVLNGVVQGAGRYATASSKTGFSYHVRVGFGFTDPQTGQEYSNVCELSGTNLRTMRLPIVNTPVYVLFLNTKNYKML